MLTFLLQDHSYSDQFLLGAGRQLDEFERKSRDSMIPAQDWNRQSFYFNDREWKADGYGGISHAAEGIGTSEANLTTAPEATTGLVSRYLDQVANSDGFNPDDAQPASPYVADLLKFYMPAVDDALRFPTDVDGDGGSTDFAMEYLGETDYYPQIFTQDLDSLMQVAVSTESGSSRVAEGIGAYQQTRVNNISALLATDPQDIDLRSELKDILQRGSALQGFGEYSVGQVKIDSAASRDAQVQGFIDLTSQAAGLVPLPGADQIGDLGSKALKFGYSQSVDLGTDAAGEAFASHEDVATSTADHRATAGSNRVKITAFLSLAQAGVIAADQIPESFLDGNHLLRLEDIPEGEVSNFSKAAMEEVNNYVSNADLELPYKNEFLAYYGSAG